MEEKLIYDYKNGRGPVETTYAELAAFLQYPENDLRDLVEGFENQQDFEARVLQVLHRKHYQKYFEQLGRMCDLGLLLDSGMEMQRIIDRNSEIGQEMIVLDGQLRQFIYANSGMLELDGTELLMLLLGGRSLIGSFDEPEREYAREEWLQIRSWLEKGDMQAYHAFDAAQVMELYRFGSRHIPTRRQASMLLLAYDRSRK